MCKKFFQKSGTIILIFLVITFLTFSLTWLSPSDPAEIKLSKTGIAPTQELLDATRKEMGLDQPMLVQYGNWLAGVLTGDMGASYRTNEPVMDELLKALPTTIVLTVFTMLLVVVFSIPIGILCAKYKDGVFDNIMRFITYFFTSIPSFVLGLVLLYVLSVRLNWFTVSPNDGLKGYLMPAFVLGLSLSAWYIRQVRSITLNELSKEYIAGLRARGVQERDILYRHVLKNVLLPVITLIGNSFGMLLGGTTIVENIFSLPGIGHLAIESIHNRDYPVILGYVVWMAVIFLVVNWIVDLSYGWVDPRVRRQQEGNV